MQEPLCWRVLLAEILKFVLETRLGEAWARTDFTTGISVDGAGFSMPSSSHRPRLSQCCVQAQCLSISFGVEFLHKGAKRISRAAAHAQTWYNCAVWVGFILQKAAHSHGVGIYSYTREECAPLQPLVSASTAPVNVINVVQSCRNQKQSQNDHCAKFGFLIVHWITSVFSLVAQSAGRGLSEISRLPLSGESTNFREMGALLCIVVLGLTPWPGTRCGSRGAHPAQSLWVKAATHPQETMSRFDFICI